MIGRKDFGEADKIIVFLTEREGKLKALAKGVRKINSRRLSSLELGNQVKLLVYKGKAFDIITEVAVIDYFGLKTSSTQLGGIFFLCELVNRLLPEGESNRQIYQQFLEVRKAIKSGKIEKIVFFEAELLKLLGYGLEPRIKEWLEKRKLREAHQALKTRIETIIERPIKSLAIFY